MSLRNKISAHSFFDEVDSVSALAEAETAQVIRWLDDHGEPFLKRKVAIGKNVEEARKLDRMHTEFKDKIAENTYMNATQLQHASEELIRAGEINVQRALEYTNRLKQRIDQFSRKVDSRTKLLYLAKNFYTHYCEIMDYYTNTLLARTDRLVLVDPDPSVCEENKLIWVQENDKWREVSTPTLSTRPRCRPSTASPARPSSSWAAWATNAR